MPAPGEERRIIFACEVCGTKLSVSAAQQGLSAPCPRCGSIVAPPGAAKPVPPREPGTAKPAVIQPAPRPSARGMHGSVASPATASTASRLAASGHRTPKPRIVAGTGIDFRDQDRRESFLFLRFVAAFLVVAAICAAVVWILHAKAD